MPKKPKPDMVITQGTHLTKCVYTGNGAVKLIWDWDKLLEEVKAATGLVNLTETRVKKTRKKKEV